MSTARDGQLGNPPEGRGREAEPTAGSPLLDGHLHDEEAQLDRSLRPRTLDEYVGQHAIKGNLRVFILAARDRGEPLDHTLLYGAPGLGKTTLANILANEMGVKLKATSGPALERPIDLLVILSSLEPGDVLFIDEIHRLSRVIEEILYPAMEDFTFDRIVGKGTAERTRKIRIPPFTLIGATTRGGNLSAPLRARFGIPLHLDHYKPDELAAIVTRSAGLTKIEIREDGAHEIARRARGTPRVANRLLRRVRDFAQVDGEGIVTREIADYALGRLGIDERGLDEVDRRILDTLVHKFKGNPVGLDTLAAMVNEEAGNLEEVYEPYLLQMGFLNRTPRGRTATPLSFKLLGVVFPGDDGQGKLW
ncbi:MAG: Holliday junction branch migration DNA helicase RuvB [Armatimonadetes bacterium]|nr:Holliday junction branch migration DNA helicase RuvB [Armatimonadota bacterium]